MKYLNSLIISVLLITCYSLPVNAQWILNSVNNANIQNTNSGNVGIGTGPLASPASKLQVKNGNIQLDHANSYTTGNLLLGGRLSSLTGLRLFHIANADGNIEVRTTNASDG